MPGKRTTAVRRSAPVVGLDRADQCRRGLTVWWRLSLTIKGTDLSLAERYRWGMGEGMASSYNATSR
ncbi:hypothetical protein THIOKS13330062 [Thiocapsa sp. KS1]|nr:hypothetical protein THIOKS13330062 [Thiocapsa sp. KS1]